MMKIIRLVFAMAIIGVAAGGIGSTSRVSAADEDSPKAIRAVLEVSGLRLDQIDRFEINEAFAAQTLACERELGLDHAKLNVNGGAIAIGHPLAATGVRLAITLARELKRSNGRYGIASACIGGGQGIALLVENAPAVPG